MTINTAFSNAQTNIEETDILTPEERNWVNQNPVIKSTFKADSAPLEHLSSGRPAGFSVDYLNLVAKKAGLTIEYVRDIPWDKQLEKLKSREIDISHNIALLDERLGFLNFTKPYLDLPMYYYAKVGAGTIDNISDLEGKKVGSVAGWATTLQYRMLYPQVNIVEVPSIRTGLVELSLGNIDVLVGLVPSTDYLISQNLIMGIKVSGTEPIKELANLNMIRLASRSDIPLLNSILEKAMDEISDEEFQTLTQKWRDRYNLNDAIVLTPEELEWLEDHKVIKVAIDPMAPPFEFIDENGEISGLAGSYLQVISKKLGVKFEWIGNKTWSEAIQSIKDGSADLLPSLYATESRKEFLSFSEGFLSFNTVIFAKEDGPVFGNLESLSGYRLAQVTDFAETAYVKDNYPDIEVIETNSVLEALQLVSTGKADAYIGDIPLTANILAINGLAQIVVVGEVPYENEFVMGTRKELPLLASSIQKALQSMSMVEKTEISKLWLGLRLENSNDDSYEIIRKIAVPTLFVFFGILFWLFTLHREVKRRKIVENELILSQRRTEGALAIAEKANAAKSNFLANMSHEIRTPLNAIIGFSEVMSSGLFGEIKEKRYKGYLKDITKSGQHLETVINDILDLSKIEAGKWHLKETDFNLNDCLDDCLRLVETDANKKNIKLINGTEHKAIIVNGDEHAFKRIFMNLLSNSIKFTPDGGIIDCNIKVNHEKYICVTIKDTGIGIADDKLEQVLSPFGQVHEVRNINEAGTGLGLSIVTQLVELHGGKFLLKSKIAVGTNAIVRVPLDRLVS